MPVPTPLLIIAGGIAILATSSAHIRVVGARKDIAIDVAARGINVSVLPVRLDCTKGMALAHCLKHMKPLPV